MNRSIIILIFILILMNLAYAAKIEGTVYDFSLDRMNNVIVEINTQPIQREIAKEGYYSFEVQKGTYILTAKTSENNIITQENITINEEGVYKLDLIGFLDLTEEELLTSDTEPLEPNVDDLNNYYILIPIIIFLILIAFLIYFKKLKKKETNENIDDLTEKILEIMKKEKRTTQKEIRKQLPYSEAKISLVLTELESKGKIEKIKKGRANVIILKS